MGVMAVKGEHKDVIGDDTRVGGRRDGSITDTVKNANARGRVEQKDKPAATPLSARRVVADTNLAAEAPSKITAAVEASKDAFEHMLQVISETTTARQGLMSDVFIGEKEYRGPVTNEALAAFVGAVKEITGDKGISVEAARRAGLLAAAATAWEDALGSQLDTAHVRELLGGVSKQRISELLQQHRLIGIQASNARWQFPAFQFAEGRLPAAKLAEAFWQLSTRAVDPWSAASWCVSPNSQLDGRTPAEVAATDAELVATVGELDADRLSR